MNRLSALLSGIEVSPTDKFGVSCNDMEAFAFALLAFRTFSGLPGTLPSVTGTREETLRGAVYPVMTQRGRNDVGQNGVHRVFCVSLALAASACSYPGGRTVQTETLHYQCDPLPLTVTLDNARERVNFILDGQQLSLPQVASGARYSNGQYSFWSKSDRAFIERQDTIIIDDCVIQGAASK